MKRILVVLAAATVGATAVAPAAQALRVRYELGTTDCIVHEFSGGAVGLATDFPRVYAINATRFRDTQYVSMQNIVYTLSSSDPATARWVVWARGDWYQGLASDNNYLIAWRNTRTGVYDRFPYEREQFIVKYSGAYRVAQRIVWHRKGNVPGYDPGAWWLSHIPGFAGNQFCIVG
jgi:hypothetical protein